jgi:hypothetical protein
MPAEERGDDMILPNVELKPESIRSSCTRREVRSTWLGTRVKIRFYFNFISFAGNWKRNTFTLLIQEILLKEETVKNYLILDNGSLYNI